MKVGTWNVRTLRRAGKLENAKREMERNGLDVLGMSEVRWKDNGDVWSGGYRFLFSGNDEGQMGWNITNGEIWQECM